MTSLLKTTGVTRLAALALGAVLAVTPINASALTLAISEFDPSTNNVIASEVFRDGEDSDVLDGVIEATLISFGGSTVGSVKAVSSDGSRSSILSLEVTDAVAALDRLLLIDVLDTNFGGGRSRPQERPLTFTSNASSLSINGSVFAGGWTDEENELGVLRNGVGSFAALTSTSIGINEAESQVLTDPFSMTILTQVNSNTTATFNATLTAAVPLPAAGWLMIAGLGGLAALRRRKRAA